MADKDMRRKNRNWIVSDDGVTTRSVEHTQLAVLMDIRDELQTLVSLAQCHRIPRALDAMHEMGVDLRRKKRAAAKRRRGK